MEESIWDFLEQFTAELLSARRVLVPDEVYTFLLRSPSVEPLLGLMRQQGVYRLYHSPEGRVEWELTADRRYYNSRAGTVELRRGNVDDLQNPGLIFDWQNRHINPFYRQIRPAWVFGRMIHPPEEPQE